MFTPWKGNGQHTEKGERVPGKNVPMRDLYSRVAAKSVPVKIYFPADPPPLGVPVNLPVSLPALDPVPEELFGEMMEPYFPQLNSHLLTPIEEMGKPDAERLAEYRNLRKQLLLELRIVIERVAESDADARYSAFSELAHEQVADLRKHEAQAEDLRDRLVGSVDWYELRQWRLGEGNLDLPREAVQAFEYQVVRATAFYLDGLTTAQRGLLREALQLMDDPPGSELEHEGFVFFSPEMMRVQFPSSPPVPLAERIAAFVQEKGRLREKLRDAAYLADFSKSGYSRRMALQRLVSEDADRLDALEDEAEQIRLEIGPYIKSVLSPKPKVLPSEVLTRIDQYLVGTMEVQQAFREAMGPVASERPPENVDVESEEYARIRAEFVGRVEAARDRFMKDNAAAFADLDAMLETIETSLDSYLIASDYKTMSRASDAFLMKFLQRYREEHAYYEYGIAAFEPGLSVAQRRLLFAAAVARLRLPLAGAEKQPVAAPQTILPPQTGFSEPSVKVGK